VYNGEYTFNTQWAGTSNLTGNFWTLTNAAGKELYGGSAANPTSQYVCCACTLWTFNVDAV
jgi:hypothetical protein